MVDAIEMATLDNYTVHPYRYSNVALGDVDVDGGPEIIFLAEVYQTIQEIEDTADTSIPEPDTGSDSAEPNQPAEPSDNPIVPPPPNPNGQGPGNQNGNQNGNQTEMDPLDRMTIVHVVHPLNVVSLP